MEYMTLLGCLAVGWPVVALLLAPIVGRAIRFGRGPELSAPQETDTRG